MNFLNATIRYSFYLIFLLVPLVFAGNTSELFEFNKMWLTFGLTTIIMLAWFSKMIIERKIFIQRTPLDIPLGLFLLSQIISTIFSLDQHVSWWGYYSRFNGGLLSTITYIFLYYAIASNFTKRDIYKLLGFTLIGGVITALWGLPSRFGYDPTCLLFRGTLDTSCWTEAFRPTVRVFSTLGQPAWFAAYLAALLPLALYYSLRKLQSKQNLTDWKFWLYATIVVIFYLNLLFTNTRAGFLAFITANVIFWLILFIKKIFTTQIFLRYFIVFHMVVVVCSFIFGTPLGALHKFTLPGLQSIMANKAISAQPTAIAPPTEQTTPTTQAAPAEPPPTQTGISDSGDIRKYVWAGAIDAWKANPVFGTGVETFAFAYYKFRPVGHNMTSEWDYLYNKAHNEYLNYLTTTGIFGLGTYLFFLGLFSLRMTKGVLQQKTTDNDEPTLLTAALFAGWISILISNFFGFSVVIMNLFLFLFPLFIFILEESLNPKKVWEFSWGKPTHGISPYQWTFITVLTVIAIYFIVILCRYWYADTKYALGYNLDRVGSYQDAYPLLLEAAQIKSGEAVYKDELAINVGVLATALAAQKDQTHTAEFINTAITLNNEVVTAHPNNVVFWKNRVRLFYTLAQIGDPNQQALYYQEALKAIQKASELAPTDAKITYNLGVLYGQNGDIPKGIAILDQAIKMKPDYRDPYFALGLFYHQLAIDPNGRVINAQMQQKAVDVYKFILTNFNPNDEEVKKNLSDWGAL